MIRRYRGRKKNNEKEETGSENNLLKDSTIILALLTGISYVLAFSYEKGYKEYYGLDELFFSEISINKVIISFVSFSTVFMLIIQSLMIYKDLFRDDTNKPLVKIFRFKFIPLSSLILLFSIITGDPSLFKYALLGVGAWAIWVFIVIPFISFKDYIGYRNKIEAYAEQKIEPTLYFETLITVLKRGTAVSIITLLVLCYALSSMVSIYGQAKASQKETYLIVTYKNENYAVIADNGENYITAPINVKQKEIYPEFIIIEAKSELKDQLKFRSYRFKGGLEVKDKTTIK